MSRNNNGGAPSFQLKTSEACGEKPTLSEIHLALGSFNVNQIGALVLPLVSDSKKLIWVHSEQFDLQLDGASELEKAFNRFPYLTQSQTATLAQRCSLHPDQVKVWFMMQRLHYGISWDHEDILDVKRKIKREGLGNEELQKDRGGSKNVKRKLKESGGKKAEEARTEPSPNEGRVMPENTRDDQQSWIKMKWEQLLKEGKSIKVEELEEDKWHTPEKQKRMTATDKMGEIKRADEGAVIRAEEVEMAGEEIKRESTKFKPTQSETKPEANQSFTSVHKSFAIHDEAPDLCRLLTPLSPNQAFLVCPLTDSLSPDIHGTPLKSSTDTEEILEMEFILEEDPHAALTTPPKLRELKELTS